jgi:membrane-associated phospholipid phosphatase
MVQGIRVVDLTWWPVDKVIAGYLGLTGLLILLWWRDIPSALVLILLHAAALALLWVEVKRPHVGSFAFRHWYPLPYVALCYKEMSILIPPVRGRDFDRELAALDLSLWGAHPTVWLEHIQSAPLTEVMQILYSLFVPAVLMVAYLLWRLGRFEQFRQYAFLIALGFLASYLGYLLVPARGPRFLLASLQTRPLAGLAFYEPLRRLLDDIESAHYDCFPSGHVELTTLAWWGSRWVSGALSKGYFAYTLSIIFATVYLRYHYTIDVLAGAVVACALALLMPYAYRFLQTEGAVNWHR